MNTCMRCEGFAPPSLSCCPHCGAPIEVTETTESGAGKLLRHVGQAAAAAATAMTLMACYGAPDDFGPYEPTFTTSISTACSNAEDLLLDQELSDDNFSEGASDAADLSCSDVFNARERIYRFEAPAAGSLHFEWEADNPLSVAVRETCTASAEALCEAPTVQGSIDLDLDADEEVFLLIDSQSAVTYDFTASFTPAP